MGCGNDSKPHQRVIAMKRFAAVVLLTASAATHASPIEVWDCADAFNPEGPVLVTATVESGRKKGHISVAGVTKAAAFEVAGFDRRWDFGLLQNGRYRYAFIIEPNGDAKYFDFGDAKTARPSNLMKCRQVDAKDAPNE